MLYRSCLQRWRSSIALFQPAVFQSRSRVARGQKDSRCDLITVDPTMATDSRATGR